MTTKKDEEKAAKEKDAGEGSTTRAGAEYAAHVEANRGAPLATADGRPIPRPPGPPPGAPARWPSEGQYRADGTIEGKDGPTGEEQEELVDEDFDEDDKAAMKGPFVLKSRIKWTRYPEQGADPRVSRYMNPFDAKGKPTIIREGDMPPHMVRDLLRDKVIEPYTPDAPKRRRAGVR
jgi:hypothetical protein